MKEVKITSCCIFYTLDEMIKNRVKTYMPYLLFHSRFKGIIAVERLHKAS